MGSPDWLRIALEMSAGAFSCPNRNNTTRTFTAPWVTSCGGRLTATKGRPALL